MSGKVKTEVRQEQITRAARKILADRGFGGLTIEAIAGKVGIANSNVYRHFRNKEAVIFAIIADTRMSLIEMVREVCSKERTATVRLENIFYRHIAYMEEHKDLPVILFSSKLSGHGQKVLDHVKDGMGEYAAEIGRILKEGVKSGEFLKDIDIDTAVVTFMGFVQFLVLQWLVLDFPGTPTARGKKVWKIYLNGISARA